MIYPIVSFPVTLSDPWPRFQGHGVIRPVDAVGVLCAELTRDLFAIAKFLFFSKQVFKASKFTYKFGWNRNNYD